MLLNSKNGNSAETTGVINAILAYTGKQKEEAKAHIDDQKMVMDARVFFRGDDEEGFMSKQEFIAYVTMTESELKGLEQFLIDITRGTKLTIPFFTKTDKVGKAYYWITQNSATATRGYKLVHNKSIEKLIAAYQFGMYRFQLSLGELFTEATKKAEEAA